MLPDMLKLRWILFFSSIFLTTHLENRRPISHVLLLNSFTSALRATSIWNDLNENTIKPKMEIHTLH